MALKCVVFVAVAFCAIAFSNSIEIKERGIPRNQQEVIAHLANQLVSKKYAELSPADASIDDCFNDYNKKQEVVTNEYNEEYNTCAVTAIDAKAKLSEENAEKRSDMIERGQGICGSLSSCEQYNDGLEFFNCYSKQSTDSYPLLYRVSVDSEKEIQNLNVQYAKIANDEKQCCSVALNKYVGGLSEANSVLQLCLAGGLPTQAPESMLNPAENEDVENFREGSGFWDIFKNLHA